jgi:AraC family transcriptional regulator
VDPLEAIEEAIGYLEVHLGDAPKVEEIAAAAGLSSAHFQRLFHAIAGETLGAYVRRRRLSRSIEPLLESGARILEIALEAGFESQEAYTRAFKAQFGLPPGQFRARGQRLPGSALPKLSRRRLELRNDPHANEPRIIDREATSYVGYRSQFISVLSDDSDGPTVVPDLWQRFTPHRERVAHRRDSNDYGLSFIDLQEARTRGDEVAYLVGTAVDLIDAVPAAMSAVQAPASHYAVFVHDAPEAMIPETILFALLEWLPRSSFDYWPGVEIEVHSQDRQVPIEFWLPVQDRN